MIHKKKEKRRTFCYLKPTVVTTENALMSAFIETETHLNSTGVTTEAPWFESLVISRPNLNSIVATTEVGHHIAQEYAE